MTMLRNGLIFGAVTLLFLAACGYPAVERPMMDFGSKAAEQKPLDPVSDVRIVFTEGASSEAQGKVTYVTHVPSGSQIVIGREGQVISRHDGRVDGPARLDAVLAHEGIMGDIITGVPTAGSPLPQHADWLNFIKFEGVTYMAWGGRGLVRAEDLGAERYRIAFRLRDYAGAGYRSQDGGAAFLAPGTPIFELKRYDPKFRLAAMLDGTAAMFFEETRPRSTWGPSIRPRGGSTPGCPKPCLYMTWVTARSATPGPWPMDTAPIRYATSKTTGSRSR